MDHLIVDSTPKGSAILAYGRMRGPRLNRRLLVTVALCLAVAGIIVAAMNIKLTLLLPRERLLLVALRPRDAFTRLNTDLRQSLPAPWRAALDSRSRWPVILGVALDERGETRPFAVLARTATLPSATDFEARKNGLFVLLTDKTAPNLERVPLSELWRLTRSARGHAAAWTLDGRLLARLAGAESNDPRPASPARDWRGVWDGLRGEIVPAGIETDGDLGSVPALDYPVFSILGGNNEARPALSAVLSRGIDLRDLEQPPSSLGLDPQTEGLYLSWHSPLSARDLTTIGSALGPVRFHDFSLQDRTLVNEIAPNAVSTSPPFVLPMRENPSSTWEIAETEVKLTGSNVQTAVEDPNCTGNQRLTVRNQALENVLRTLKAPEIWRQTLHSFKIVQNNGRAFICLN